MKKESREARKHPRYTKIIQIECTVNRFPDDLMGDKAKLKVGETFRATTINVSQTGMLINYDFLLPERTSLDIVVNEEAVSKKPMHFKTRIAWTKRNAYKIFGRFAAGLHIEEGNKKDINKLVEHFN